MATQETKQIDAVISNTRRKMMLMGGTALAGLALTKVAEAQTTVTDNDILNFALNLEYLEAHFYTIATEGVTADKSATSPISVGGSGAGTVKYSGGPVPFTLSPVKNYAAETALEERRHVLLLQGALGNAAVAQPMIDLQTSFTGLGSLVGVPTFNPFHDDYQFLLGAYIFEDVGVSAYHGAAPLITDKVNVLPPAVKIHAVEAYHAGLIRTTIAALDQTTTPIGPAGTLMGLTTAISAVRAKLDGTNTAAIGATASTGDDDLGITSSQVTLNGTANNSTTSTYTILTLTDADSNSLGFARTTTQVLAIVSAGGANNMGGFFPVGLNGTIK